MANAKADRAAQRRARVIRWTLLGAVFTFMTGFAFAHQYRIVGGKPVPIDALCPFGGVESFLSVVTGAGFIDKTAASALILAVGTVGMALVFRRSFCGQLCPLGAMQEAFGALGRRIFGRLRTIPASIDRPARLLKYAVLAVFTLWTWSAAQLVMRPFDPWAAWAHITSDELLVEFGIGAAVLGVSLAGSLLYDRFFCKYLCPTGAFLGLFSRASLLSIGRNAESCISCSACDKACPMNVSVSDAGVITSSECISCNECVNACPVADTLTVSAAKPGRRLSPVVASGSVIALLLLVVALTTASGTFRWTMPTLAEAAAAAGGPGGFDSSLIKGYMSMAEISDATGIPAETFTQTWGVPAEDLGKPMKEIGGLYGFSPHDVKDWVGAQLAATQP